MGALDHTVRITLKDGVGYLSGVPTHLQQSLERSTSFRVEGYQFTRAYKRGKWDGWTHLLRHSKFPAGLLPRITDFLGAHDVSFEITNLADPVEKPNLGVECVGIEDRWYQDDAVEAVLLNPRGVIRAPTGSGKTAIGARAIAARGKWALVVVPTIDLLYQYKEFLECHLELRSVQFPSDERWDSWGGSIGQLGDGVVDPQPITVSTIRTAAKAMDVAYESYEYAEYDDRDDTDVDRAQLRTWLDSIGTLLVDEAHILGADTVFGVATKLRAPNKYGFSASPWRDDGADLMIEAATGPVIYRIGTKTLVDEGYLVPPVIRVHNTRGWWLPAAWDKHQFQDCYRTEIVENGFRNQKIAEVVETIGEPTLVLVKQVKHGRLLEKLIPQSIFLSGRNSGDERTRVYDQLRNGEVQVIIATTIADLGLDLPILRALVLAGGGKSSTRHLQRIGRVARPYPGKKTALVVDFDDGHVHKWFANHCRARRKIEQAEWAETAIWI